MTALALLLAMGLHHSGAAPITNPQAAPDSPAEIAIRQPQFGFGLIPGSTRRLYSQVTHGKVRWQVKNGDAKLSANEGPWVDVVAGAKGSTCKYEGQKPNYRVVSATQFTVVATSVDDPSKAATALINVCNPPVEISVVPFYRALYANQYADVQSLIRGSVDQTVHWAISSQPGGGDGKIGDATLRDTVFHASVAGRYVLTATSNADKSKSSTAILYVTGHAMPYASTPNQTEPVDCSPDPAMKGKVYDVGPSQPLKTLAEVPFTSVGAGTTIRLHNEDKSGEHPTEFHEYIQVQTTATQEQPVRICGVADSKGRLPIMDGDHATGRKDASAYSGGTGIITLYRPGFYANWPTYHASAYISVEGLELRNSSSEFTYVKPDGTPGTWGTGSACLRVFQVHNAAFVGNDLNHCANGGFSGMNATGEWGNSTFNILWEGNHLHDNGTAKSFFAHQMYLQAWGEVVQFNRIDNYNKAAGGSNLKARGIQLVLRYNYLGDGSSRQMDLVDPQDAVPWMSFAGWLHGGRANDTDQGGKEPYPADQVASWQEAYQSDFVYGNIYQNGTARVPIHYSMDSEHDEGNRAGTLYFYNNTFYETVCPKCGGMTMTLFDTAGSGGTNFKQVEFPTIQIFNNIIWLTNLKDPFFRWNNYSSFIGVAGRNLITAGYATNSFAGGDGTGWISEVKPTNYQHADNLASHVSGFDSNNIMTSKAMPFDPKTWLLHAPLPAGEKVPAAICQMPARFQYLPEQSHAIPRAVALNLGATDTPAQAADFSGKPNSPGRTSITDACPAR